ncbi:para-nitrobenzyl esterase [Kitasatospora sp. MAA19]|uniref:carboxylesterase family protein n=1 Tax=Kitasatospora sp. MAA19 TaxID=3035090 RepID=UPI00247576DD|nr:carboxylesterase family protein [Kitasatospora sp. MAA19]MDH6707215.1 para-nitrobenzyl esterase [Kitasatospora sp. MAA19]
MLAIETTSGPVRGFLDRGVPNWRGIPYGRIPGRFRPALPATAGDPVDADRWGPVSWQVPMSPTPQRWSPLYPDAVQHEDCLNLNIWSARPERPDPQPVLVWFHPGRHMVGGTMRTVDPWAYAARHDLVIVTANYRLGPWGWLSLADLDPEFADSTNLAVRDQLLILRWVRDNIAAFGGDPGNVTIFGLSTGGTDVATLLGVPSAVGLFHKAAIYSGNAELAQSREEAAGLAERFLNAAGSLANDAGALAELSNVALRYAHSQTLRAGQVRYHAVVDGDLIPRPPLPAVADRAEPIPVLVSVTSEEAGILEIVEEGAAVDAKYSRLIGGPDGTTRGEKVSRLSDELYVRPAERLLSALNTPDPGAGGSEPCWAQVFDYHPTTSHLAGYPGIARRAVHAADTAALFCDTDGPEGTETDRAVGAQEQSGLVRLARDGDPGWPAYTSQAPLARWIGPRSTGRADLRPLPLTESAEVAR